jgi:uncharacterized protein (DUF2236 family)
MTLRAPSFDVHREAVRARLREAAAAGRRTRSGPGSITWQINREIVVVAGWGSAILLQLAHPLVAEGVARHSTFRGHPFAGFERLFATVGAMLSLTFGDDEEAVAAAAAINVVHDRVAGRLEAPSGGFAAGTPYSAHDPELLRWVHATLLYALPRTYGLLVGPLPSAARDMYCLEATGMEALLGIPAGYLPSSGRALDAYLDAMLARGPIEATATSRALARAVLYPPMSGLLWPMFRPVRLITIGLLPPTLREAYGFRWTAREARALGRWAAVIRGVRRLAPPPLREWPAARARGIGPSNHRLIGARAHLDDPRAR